VFTAGAENDLRYILAFAIFKHGSLLVLAGTVAGGLVSTGRIIRSES
jgi:hypothetical protein